MLYNTLANTVEKKYLSAFIFDNILYHIFISTNVNCAHALTPKCHSDISPWEDIGAKL
jgi:hypothetical protein